MRENKKLEFRGGSFMALIPFAIFIVITIGLSFANAADLNMMIGAGVVGLLVGMLFVKDLEAYWDTILAGLGSKVGMTAVMLWLVVGIYGNILKSGHIVEGLVWLGVQLNMSGAAFTVAAFVFAALFAMATGSGFGTISTMSFILYPAGILLGSNPAVLAGAILSGAAVGDNLAPVSDTTIIAATSQEYNNKEGAADIGGTVRTRSPLVIVGFGCCRSVLYLRRFWRCYPRSQSCCGAARCLSDARRSASADPHGAGYLSCCAREEHFCLPWYRLCRCNRDRLGCRPV